MPLRPSRIARAVECWFDAHQRPLPWRTSYDPYHVWVSEVMAQQTRMEVVVRYFGEFIARFPDVRSLADSSADEVASLWSGLGYYRRARMLREGAIDVLERFGGELPDEVEDLLSIAGIGPYTAGAIASIAFNRRAAIVDGNVARIVARIDGIDEAAGSGALIRTAWRRAGELVAASRAPRSLNQGLMELGALICKPVHPDCSACPLRTACAAFESGRTGDLPRPRAKAATRELRIPLYLIVDAAGRILMRRESGKLMRDLFHLPHGASSLLTGAALPVKHLEPIGSFRHTVTNRRIQFEVVAAELGAVADGDEYLWVSREELPTVPHPSYVAKALRIAARASQKRATRL